MKNFFLLLLILCAFTGCASVKTYSFGQDRYRVDAEGRSREMAYNAAIGEAKSIKTKYGYSGFETENVDYSYKFYQTQGASYTTYKSVTTSGTFYSPGTGDGSYSSTTSVPVQNYIPPTTGTIQICTLILQFKKSSSKKIKVKE